MSAETLSLIEIARQTNIPLPSLVRLRNIHGAEIPSKGEGLMTRYPEDAIEVFKSLHAGHPDAKSAPLVQEAMPARISGDMDVVVGLEAIREVVAELGRVVETATTRLILTHILARACGGRLELRATDQEVSLIASLDALVEHDGEVAIPAKMMAAILKKAKGDEVRLNVEPGSDILVIRAGKSRYKVRGLPADDFPVFPEVQALKSVSMPFPLLREMLGKVAFAISRSDARVNLEGALIHAGSDSLAVVATDGNRLAYAENEVQGVDAGEALFVPFKAVETLRCLRREEGEVNICADARHVAFRVGGWKMVASLIETQFPNYLQITDPSEEADGFTADRKELAAAVHRVGLMAELHAPTMLIRLKGNVLHLEAMDPSIGDAAETLAVEPDCDPFGLAINPVFMKQALEAIATERVTITVQSPDAGVGFLAEPGDCKHVVVTMPIRV